MLCGIIELQTTTSKLSNRNVQNSTTWGRRNTSHLLVTKSAPLPFGRFS